VKQPKTYIIYGANSCIGAELAKMILPLVENLVLFYHERDYRIESLMNHEKVKIIQSDVCKYEDMVYKFKEVSEEVDVSDMGAVFLPAVRSHDSLSLRETSMELTNQIIDVNLYGAIHFMKAVLGIFYLHPTPSSDGKSARIVMVGSDVSRTGLKNGSIYAATKSAMANLVKSVAMEEGLSNVLINTVSPGPVDTDNSDFNEEYTRFRKEYFETQKALTSLNRVAEVVDICNLIMFLTSIENKHISGEEIFIRG